MDTNRYGSRAWIESQYAASKDDPWGLDWRPSQQYRYARMLEVLSGVLHLQPRPLDVIDVGCATGGFTAMLGSLNCRDGSLTGIDIAESAVLRAALRFPNLHFHCMALDQAVRKFEGKADVVTCMEVLYYLPDEKRAEAVRQLKSMLKPGGHLLVSSMIAPAPYFSFDALKAQVAQELNPVASGVLYLKPLVLLEKLCMRLGRTGSRNGLVLQAETVHRCERHLARWLSRIAQSHAYVIGRHD